MKYDIKRIIEKAVLELQEKENWGDFEMPNIEVDYSKNESFGDYSTNVAMILAGKMKKNSMSARGGSALGGEIAESLSSVISHQPSDFFSKVETAKPGYINFYLSKEYLQKKVEEINNLGEKYGNSQIGKGIKVNNEFISANPTGPLHLGNGRGGFFGDCLGNILRKNSFDVTNEYYVNDAGEQVVNKLAHSILKDGEAIYAGDYIDYVANKVDKNASLSLIGASASEIILSDFIKPTIADRMKIKVDLYTHEKKDLVDSGHVEKAIEFLKKENITFEEDGAMWLKTTKFGDDKDRVLIKENGQETYFASDCGYILNKIGRGFEKIIEIWGADHHGYISRFRAAAEALGFKGELKFVVVQLVRLVKDGKEARMSKRAGNVVYIDELIDEVGHDVARFFFLMYSPDTHMTFDLDLAKEKSEKNPVFYVQYAHARICSILAKCSGWTATNGSNKANYDALTHEKELNLIRELNKFPELVEEIAQNYEVHKLPYYAIKLADKFHSFYNDCRVIDEENPELTGARLELVKAVRIVLGEALRLIGVSAPEHM